MNVGVGVVVVVLMLAVVHVVRQPTPFLRARSLRRSAFGLMVAVGLLFGAFVVGEALSDPGGWAGALIVGAWLGPLAAAVVVARRWPAAATALFAVVLLAAVAVSVCYAIAPDAWNAFEDRNGPVRTIAVFVLSVAIAVLGLRRPLAAGWMLIALGLLPVAISTLGSGRGIPTLALVSSPAFVAGVLYLIAAVIDGPAPAPRVTDRPGVQPKAA